MPEDKYDEKEMLPPRNFFARQPEEGRNNMIPWPNKPEPMDEKVVFIFPREICCNCGCNQDLTIVEQEARFVRYFFWGGRTSVFHFKLPFCRSCSLSSGEKKFPFVRLFSRRPVRILKVRQEWITGQITGIKFGFKCHEYEKEFIALNGKSIREKVVETVVC